MRPLPLNIENSMCTVSFIPAGDRVFITSNRDEKIVRNKAIPPKQYISHNVKLLFPKDGEAGGTWIALRQNGNAVVLLNGGFQKHIPEPSYKKSRGLILIEIITAAEHLNHFKLMSLEQIEPFTLVLWEKESLYECRWDGFHKSCKELSASTPHLWSSVTLYDESVRKKRESWFAGWLKVNPNPALEDILQLHLFGGDGNANNDFRMNRNNQLMTVSVTGMEIESGSAKMKYLDLADSCVYENSLSFLPALAT